MTMLLLSAPGRDTGAGTPQYTLRLAADAAEIAAAQRLRYQVFGDEVGARLHAPVAGHDSDEFDPHCDHMIVVDERDGAVVATYRLLPPGRTPRRYAATEFELSGLASIADQLVETGRSCVHPDHRAGAAINLIWAGIARYMHLYGYRYVGGCASVDVRAGDATAAAVWSTAQAKHLSPEPWRVTPHEPWLPAGAGLTEPVGRVAMPPLLHGYLRLGAWIGGAPAYDPDFGCADFYVLLDTHRINERYMRHFLGDTAVAGSQPATT
ncbi:MAG TPA: GNAT family N-acyltransferase [Micromonosporaceae bacterium]|jgi:putative hemolysin